MNHRLYQLLLEVISEKIKTLMVFSPKNACASQVLLQRQKHKGQPLFHKEFCVNVFVLKTAQQLKIKLGIQGSFSSCYLAAPS